PHDPPSIPFRTGPGGRGKAWLGPAESGAPIREEGQGRVAVRPDQARRRRTTVREGDLVTVWQLLESRHAVRARVGDPAAAQRPGPRRAQVHARARLAPPPPRPRARPRAVSRAR